ncbi:hypothetical protein [Halorhabdus amylolytica]|uniref:hypothetical protein n=1 Tax=Halorhabdus amylolytica TaxID=2559573 RepID=UPI0020BF0315|nr:hypothetical protein [Halorhabdus amylolytica]
MKVKVIREGDRLDRPVSRGLGANWANVIDQEPNGPTRSAPLVTGIGFVVASVLAAVATAAGVSIRVGGFDAISIGAGLLALALLVWGLRSATRGTYRQGVGALSGGAGLVLIFLAPHARSAPLFVGTGALILALGGLFLIAEGFGHVLVAVDDTDEGGTSVDEESDSVSGPEN